MQGQWWYGTAGSLLLGLLLVGFPSCKYNQPGPERTRPHHGGDTPTVVGKRHRRRHPRRRRHRKRQHRRSARWSYSSDTEQARTQGSVDSVSDTTAGDTIPARGRELYRKYCSGCHGPDRKGNPPRTPDLNDVDKRLSGAEILEVIEQGRGRMPSFDNLTDAEIRALLRYLSD